MCDTFFGEATVFVYTVNCIFWSVFCYLLIRFFHCHSSIWKTLSYIHYNFEWQKMPISMAEMKLICGCNNWELGTLLVAWLLHFLELWFVSFGNFTLEDKLWCQVNKKKMSFVLFNLCLFICVYFFHFACAQMSLDTAKIHLENNPESESFLCIQTRFHVRSISQFLFFYFISNKRMIT